MDRLEDYMRNTWEDDKLENYKKMIIELSEKYNINSKYTSFITVYERKDKLVEIPRYQETNLSNKFAKGAIMNKMLNIFGIGENDEEYEEYEECYDMELPSFKSRSSGDLNIPTFLRKEKVVDTKWETIEIKKTNEEILEEKVNDYYKTFISQDEKSVLTFLLYALYYLRKGNTILNYNELLRFLGKHRDELLENELYLKLLCLCYKQLDNNRFLDKRETLELMDDNFRKIAVTNLKISVEFKELSESEIQKIVDNDKVIENIDKVIQHLIKTNYSEISWLR